MEKNHAHNLSTILLNEQELGLAWNRKCLSELEILIYEISNCLKAKDIETYKFLGKNYGRYNVLSIAVNVFQKEFIEMVFHVMDCLFEQAIPFSHYGIYRLLGHKYFNNNFPGYYLIEGLIEQKWTLTKQQLKEGFLKFDRDDVWGIISKITIRAFLNISLNELKDSFTYYLRNCGEEFNKQRRSINWVKLLVYCIEGRMQFSNYIYYPDDPVIRKTIEESGNLFEQIAVEVHQFQLQHYHEWKYKFDDNEWILYEKDLEIIRFFTLDFTGLQKYALFELKTYCEHLIRIKETNKGIRNRLTDIKRGYEALVALYPELNSFKDINRLHVNHLVSYLQTIVDDNGEPRYSILTVKRTITEMKLIFNWLIDNSKVKIATKDFESSYNNPFNDITFSNTDAFINPTKYIPEEVIEEVLKYIHELPGYVQNAWIIMMHTGMRISDAFLLTENCLDFDEEKQKYILEYVQGKIAKHRANRGLDKHHRIYVHDVVAKHIQAQINDTASLREMGNTNRIFINRSFKSMAVSVPSKQQASRMINKLMQKYDIRDAFGERFNYTHHQCRKTVAVEMLTNGAPLKEVGDYLGHLRERTTSQHYKDIEMKKSAELNAKYFEYYFSEKLDNNLRDAFSQEEKTSLFKEIRLGARETPEGHGICTKHVSFGPCQKKTCIQCKFLTTGPQKLPMWRKLRDEQERYIKDLGSEYEEEGIFEYQRFRNYERQLSLLDYYRNTVTQLEEFVVRRGLHSGKTS